MSDAAPVREPLYDVQELCGVSPVDYRRPYDCREVIARLADASEFTEFKREYDAHTICGQARIHGVAVGVLGNNGPITARGAAKARDVASRTRRTVYDRIGFLAAE